MAQLTDTDATGEWLKWMIERRFCCAPMALKAATVQTIVPGDMLEDDTGLIIVANGTEADVIAIAMESIVAVGGEKILCLVRGPAIIDSDMINYAASVTWAEVSAALAALDIRASNSALDEWLSAS